MFDKNHNDAARIKFAMSCLADNHRDILIMVDVHSMKYANVAEALGISVDDVRNRLSDARKSLQAILETPFPAKKKLPSPPPWEINYGRQMFKPKLVAAGT